MWPEFDRLVGKLETASSNFKTEFTNMAASTTKLENNEKLLEDNFYNLQEQYAALCRLLPLTEPETLYITGGEVRCSVVEEDYLPLLERLGRL